MGVVAGTQVVEGDSPWPTDALGHILPGHLQVHTSWVAPFLLMDIEECPHFSLSKGCDMQLAFTILIKFWIHSTWIQEDNGARDVHQDK